MCAHQNRKTQRMTLDKAVQQEILERLKPLQPEKVILFGSYAYGEPTKDSDIDLLVVTNDNFVPCSFQENMQIRLKVSNAILPLRLRYPTDLIVHTKPVHQRFVELNSLFAKDIVDKGVILYERTDHSLA